MTDLWAKLSGWKTHIVTTFPALILLALVVVEKAGVDIQGFDTPADWVALVLAGLGFGSLRSGVATK